MIHLLAEMDGSDKFINYISDGANDIITDFERGDEIFVYINAKGIVPHDKLDINDTGDHAIITLKNNEVAIGAKTVKNWGRTNDSTKP